MRSVDVELLSEPLIDYLSHHGWMLMDTEPDIAVLRKNFGGQYEEEIVLPRDRAYVDYDQRIVEAIRFLANLEGCSERDIVEELLPQKWDILRIRITGDRIGAGWISYLDKGNIEEGVRKILFAAARFVLDPRPYFKTFYSTPAEQWLKKCRAKPPESGSYILTIQMPLQEEDNQKIPFSRKVAEYLMISLQQLIECSERPDFSLNKESSLNANLCLGLAEMKPDESIVHFDFEMKWSTGVPVNRKVPSKVELRNHHFPSIERIGQQLKPQTEISEDLFIGKVLGIDGKPDEYGNMQGEAIFSLFMVEQQIKAKAFLKPEFYKIASDAHIQNQYVQIYGNLFEKPRCSDLKDVSLFKIIVS